MQVSGVVGFGRSFLLPVVRVRVTWLVLARSAPSKSALAFSNALHVVSELLATSALGLLPEICTLAQVHRLAVLEEAQTCPRPRSLATEL